MTSNKNFPYFNFCCLIGFLFIIFIASSAHAEVKDHLTQTESGYYYTVQKGDTLWDLSKKFSDSALKWPQLWKKNPQIKNPDLIYPGQQLLITEKDWEKMGKKAPAAPSPMEQKMEENEPIYLHTRELAAPTTSSKDFTFPGIDRIGFILKEPMESSGFTSKSQDGKNLLSRGDFIVAIPNAKTTSINVGDKYISYRVIGQIVDPNINERLGYQHLFTGIIEVVSLEHGYVLCKIDEIFRDIQPNDFIIPYHPLSPQIPLKESIRGLKARIIKEEEDKNAIATNNIVLLNKGKNDGVEPGQTYPIYKNVGDITNPDTMERVHISPILIGKLIVLRSEPTSSTGYVMEAKWNISSWDFVGDLEQ